MNHTTSVQATIELIGFILGIYFLSKITTLLMWCNSVRLAKNQLEHEQQ